MKNAKNQKTCTDKNCPKHGQVTTRGRTFLGTVLSDKMSKTVVVGWSRRQYVKKYERYEVRRSRINAHNSECMAAKKGDIVKIAETRPLSKTKSFAVIEVIGKETKRESLKTEAIEEAEAQEKLRKSDDQ